MTWIVIIMDMKEAFYCNMCFRWRNTRPWMSCSKKKLLGSSYYHLLRINILHRWLYRYQFVWLNYIYMYRWKLIKGTMPIDLTNSKHVTKVKEILYWYASLPKTKPAQTTNKEHVTNTKLNQTNTLTRVDNWFRVSDNDNVLSGCDQLATQPTHSYSSSISNTLAVQ